MLPNSSIPEIKISDLYNHSVHLGHKASRWNPDMSPYIHSVKNNIHIIDLQKTYTLLKRALVKIYETISQNNKILFVGSRQHVTNLIAEYAEKSGQFYVNHRWLGGILTNWKTISTSIKKLNKLEFILEAKDSVEKYTKKELLTISRKKDKLLRAFKGIRSMNGLPNLVIVFDTNKDRLALNEAKKLNIPIIAILDTNSSPKLVDYPIPGNDDSMRSIEYFCENFTQTILTSIKQSLIDSGVDVKDLKNADEVPNVVSKQEQDTDQNSLNKPREEKNI